jgi:hypothetical protein
MNEWMEIWRGDRRRRLVVVVVMLTVVASKREVGAVEKKGSRFRRVGWVTSTGTCQWVRV